MLVNNSLVELPTPRSIRYMWNFGSLLGICLVMQIISGLWLAAHYNCDVTVAFLRVDFIIRETSIGWRFRAFHRNGARIFFVFLYIHIARGLYYRSFNFSHVWLIGCTILLLTMGTAFLGYVLPWGQIRFWQCIEWVQESLWESTWKCQAALMKSSWGSDRLWKCRRGISWQE